MVVVKNIVVLFYKITDHSLINIKHFISVAISLCVEEVEGRRKILQGRKALTRTYYRK